MVSDDEITILGSFELKGNVEERLNWFIANYFAQFGNTFMLGDYSIIDVFDYNETGRVLLLSNKNGLIFDNTLRTVEIIDCEIEKAIFDYSELALFDEVLDKITSEPKIQELKIKISGYEDDLCITSSKIINNRSNGNLGELFKEIF